VPLSTFGNGGNIRITEIDSEGLAEFVVVAAAVGIGQIGPGSSMEFVQGGWSFRE